MKLSNLIHYFRPAMKLGIMFPAAWIMRKFKPDCWIITERPDQARDNGYCFYRYLREERPDCRAFYIIDRKAADYQKICGYGNIIQFNSWRHYYYFCLSKVHISAHINGCCPDGSTNTARRLKNVIGYRDVFLPHGVSYGVSEFCLQKYARVNLFICSGKPEYDNVLKNYGYSKEEVAYTGFPRLDGWHHITVNPGLILVMPTWRLYLAQNPDTVFEETAYYHAYQNLLNDQNLADFLSRNQLKLVFYLHNDMRKYVSSFSTESPDIEIVDRDETYDIQELLKSAAILITDYSSVHFDFAYMQKPVLYYQFDREEFFSRQYQQSSFDAKKDGFGPVAEQLPQLVEKLEASRQNAFQMTDEYYQRMRSFYQLYDAHNCERVYQTIQDRIIDLRMQK